MATQLLLGSSNDPTTQKNSTSIHGESRAPENPKRGRKSGKQQNGSTQKKQPQRGMGVAQLERLRLEERWKKMTEINTSSRVHYLGNTPYPCNFDPPIAGVPVHQLPKFGAGSFGVLATGNCHGFPPAPQGGGGATIAQFFPGGFGVADTNGLRVMGSGGMESLKELPSIPKQLEGTEIDHSGLIFKKKRFSGYEMGFMEGIKEKYEEVEVVAVHRKGNAVGGAVVMEYGFFPPAAAVGQVDSNIDESSPKAASMAAAVSTEGVSYSLFGSDEASIDLSLRL
ncbi:hypothetical protein Ancab_004381 [Ancistrocladus abbreviatus]